MYRPPANPARKPESANDGEPLAVDRDADGARGGRILARRAQLAPEPAALVRERGDDHEHSADGRLQDVGRLGYGRERVQPGPDLLVVAEEVVRDAEHRERRDSRGETREPHQRQADEEREDAAHGRRDQERRDVPHRRRAQEVEEVGHRRRLLLLGDREDACRPDADGEEADVAEREHAGVPDEDVDRDDRRDRDERRDEVDLVRLGDHRADEACRDDERHGREELEAARRALIPAPRGRARA